MSLAILDLGYGNVGSIRIAFERLGAAPRLASDADGIAAADRLVLPGVGAAGHAMRAIAARGLAPVLSAFSRPLLGICLGMQLFHERSEEEETQCLGLVPGRARRLLPAPGRPVPHMGWSRLAVADPSCGLADGDYVYFAHSYACDDGPHVAARADHGGPIPAALRRGHLWGAQFHPERSGEPGARFLRAFLES